MATSVVYLDRRAPNVADVEAPRDPTSIYTLASPFRCNTTAFAGPSSLATEQWRFAGWRLGLTGFNGTVMAGAGLPTYGTSGDISQSMILPGLTSHDGLDTGVAEKASETWVIVFRLPLLADTTRDIIGNLTGTSTDGGWGMFHQQNTGLRVSTRASVNSLVTMTLPGPVVPGAIAAVAIGHQSTSRKYRFRGASTTTTALTRRLSSPIINIVLGEKYNNNGRSAPVEIFSLTAFDTYLSDANCDIAIANEVAALALNGVTVV